MALMKVRSLIRVLTHLWILSGEHDEKTDLAKMTVSNSDGEVYHNSKEPAPGAGHISIDYQSTLCECGCRGCTELYASTYILRKRPDVLKKGRRKSHAFPEAQQLTKT